MVRVNDIVNYDLMHIYIQQLDISSECMQCVRCKQNYFILHNVKLDNQQLITFINS